MASVHLSISKHSQLSCLSTRGEVIPFFLFPSASPSSLALLISAFPLLLQPFLPFHLSATLLSFYTLPSLYLYFLPAFPHLFFPNPTPPFSSHPPPSHLPCSQWNSPFSNKQSCLQHHMLANQARPEFSSPQIHLTTLWYCAALEGRGFSHEEDEREERRHGGVWDGWIYTGHRTEGAELKGLRQYYIKKSKQ